MAIEKKREYESYEEYKTHQMKKTSRKGLRAKLKRRFNRRVKVFQKRFSFLKKKGYFLEGQKVICLGSRMGEEVQAFKNFELDAIGVDLIPRLPLVIEADFNHLPFEDNTFDLVHSNSFDHAFDANLFFESVERVLKVGGHLVLDVFPKEGGNFEVTYIEDAADVKELLCKDFAFEFVEQFVPKPHLYSSLGCNPELVFRRGEK